MTLSKQALYRLEYRVDMQWAQSPVIHLGYMVEAAVQGGKRFLGMAARKSLTKHEASLVDLALWPELADLHAFTDALFDAAWAHVAEVHEDDLRLGSEFIAAEHDVRSSLRLVPLEIRDCPLATQDPAFDLEAHLKLQVEALRKILRPLEVKSPARAAPARRPARVRIMVDSLKLRLPRARAGTAGARREATAAA